eukprot:CAMPEP_0181099838 /NCGR_PEP_ID=MMETSP1071-20121207/12870_1 /TAXON_ID=35127 /ORGANISM="Thalassiosira sp., Strain NH16" /LENGTH=299 /DNA_ID=CAMNT_0023182521 /DNA_START=10 /DNA_END=909 /DNA_ORIENTATION=+
MSGLNLLLQAAGCSDDSCYSISVGSSTSLGDSIGSITTSSGGTDSSDQHMHILHSNYLSASNRDSLLRPKPNKNLLQTCSNSSLPPKKRIRLASVGGNSWGINDDASSSFQLRSDASLSTLGTSVSSYTESPTVNSEWTAASASMTPRENGLLQLCSRGRLIAHVPNSKSKKEDFGPLKRPDARCHLSGGGASGKKRKNMLVQDLDGNDMCMGYFSTMTTNASPKSSRVDEEDAAKSEAPNSAGKVASTQLPSTEGGANSAATTSANQDKLNRNSVCIDAKSKLYEAYLRALNNTSIKQ